MIDEFSIIDVFFKSIESNRSGLVRESIGDDAAILAVPNNHELLVSTDTLVEGVHFLADWPAKVIAYKALATNVSDIAAMAGKPTWCSLALTMPQLDEAWLKAFSQGFSDALGVFNVDLIGGDLTRGPLTITITIHGIVPTAKAVKRSGANAGDHVFITGHLGEPSYAVSQLGKASYSEPFFNKLFYPDPKHRYASTLQAFASSAIDISDGLAADLCHILKASKVGARLHECQLPLAKSLEKRVAKNKQTDLMLNSGDEYELCFTVPADKKVECLKAMKQKDLVCIEIGTIVKERELTLITNQNTKYPIDVKGFKHF